MPTILGTRPQPLKWTQEANQPIAYPVNLETEDTETYASCLPFRRQHPSEGTIQKNQHLLALSTQRTFQSHWVCLTVLWQPVCTSQEMGDPIFTSILRGVGNSGCLNSMSSQI